MMPMELSLVMVGRNDNYGGDFKSRLQNCIEWTFKQLTLHEIKSEIIFVNYNPLPESSILDFINWPKSNEFVSTRVLTIPSEVHEYILKTYDIKSVPVLEYFAKNAGIRRAKGKFILSMNPDILMDELIFSKFKNLNSANYYRCNRCDFDAEIQSLKTDKLLRLLSSNIDSVWYKGRKRAINPFTERKYFSNWALQTLENIWKRNSIKFSFFLNFLNINYYSHNAEFFYHCNASGDFMLLSKEHWFELKGYKEDSKIALHTDALFVVQAATHGLKEHVFYQPIYHKKHDRRFDATLENEEQRSHYLKTQFDSQRMIKNRKSIIYNSDDWGLINFELEDKIL